MVDCMKEHLKEYYRPLMQDLGSGRVGVPAGVDPGLWGRQQKELKNALEEQNKREIPVCHLHVWLEGTDLGEIKSPIMLPVKIGEVYISVQSYGENQGGVFATVTGELVEVIGPNQRETRSFPPHDHITFGTA